MKEVRQLLTWRPITTSAATYEIEGQAGQVWCENKGDTWTSYQKRPNHHIQDRVSCNLTFRLGKCCDGSKSNRCQHLCQSHITYRSRSCAGWGTRQGRRDKHRHYDKGRSWVSLGCSITLSVTVFSLYSFDTNRSIWGSRSLKTSTMSTPQVPNFPCTILSLNLTIKPKAKLWRLDRWLEGKGEICGLTGYKVTFCHHFPNSLVNAVFSFSKV